MARRVTGLHAKLTRFVLSAICVTYLVALPITATAAELSSRNNASQAAISGQRPCPFDSIFTCMSLLVPLDHFAAGNPEMLQIVFARVPARNLAQRRGVLVTIVGGPGTSGIYGADSYADVFGASIRDKFDLVFFDLRGVGLSGNLRCDDAVTDYLQTESRSATPDQEAQTIAHARAFSGACQSELGDRDRLRHYNTRQAVEDLEAIRIALGENKLWLYSESYGTQLAQGYAAAHADRVAGLILDSPVDLTLNGPQFTRAQAHAFDSILQHTLAACQTDRLCSADFDRPALAVYDALAERLRSAAIPFSFRKSDGSSEQRSLTLGALETAAATYLYTPADRSVFLRALAYAQRGELQPLARLVYASISVDPQTLATRPDPSYSDAAYFTFNCNDYQYFDGSADERARRYIASGDAVDSENARIDSVYYGELPCAFWSTGAAAPAAPPPPLPTHQIPTLLLVSTADPATPFGQASAIFKRLPNAAMIVLEGGPHVLFARGNSCVDPRVLRFLMHSELPGRRTTTCAGTVLESYAPAMQPALSRYPDLLEAFIAVERELTQNPGYVGWSRGRRFADACLQGGLQRVLHNSRQNSDLFELSNCALAEGLAISGVGSRTLDQQQFTLKAELGAGNSGTLEYTHINDTYRISGVFNGRRILLERP